MDGPGAGGVEAEAGVARATGRTIRVLIGKPGLDGHDRGARVVASALRDAGMEVIYSGLRASVPALVAAAIQEDVDVVGLSILSGAHEAICARLIEGLRAAGAEIPVIVGGVIPDEDHARLHELGVKAIFGPEARLGDLVDAVRALARGEAVPAPERTSAALGLTAIDHVSICVADLELAIGAFSRLLGRPPAHREHVEAQRAEAAFFDLGDGCAIELVTPRGGNPGLARFLQRRGDALHHLGLRVKGLREGLEALRASGVPLIDEVPRPGARGHRVAFLRPEAAGGVLVELVEADDPSEGGGR